jgi:hypothetical protein
VAKHFQLQLPLLLPQISLQQPLTSQTSAQSMENRSLEHQMLDNHRKTKAKNKFSATDLLDCLLKAGLVLIHGGMNELIDVVFQIFDEGGIICFLLPA